MSETRPGTLLDGRVCYVQSSKGHRTGIEPVLLAAFVPARAGERLVEAGTGAGAGLLCIAARVRCIEGIGIEADADLAALARANFKANGFTSCRAERARLPALPNGLSKVSHVFANPPWNDPSGTTSPDALRRLARRREPGLIATWATSLATLLIQGGTISMIVPAALHVETAEAVARAGCGGTTLFPLWPRSGTAAKLVMIQGRRGSRAAARVLPGLVLHGADGKFTGAATAILRGGASICEALAVRP